MKTLGWIVSFLGLVFTGSLAFADTPPPHTELILWHLPTTQIPPQGTHEYCATTKVPPYVPALCFGELARQPNVPHPDGFVRVQNGVQVYYLRVTGLTPWKFMYKTGGYAQNNDVYSRSMRVTNDQGVSTDLIEQFLYFPPKIGPNGVPQDYGMMRTMIVTGTLPDGTVVNLPNIYAFYQ